MALNPVIVLGVVAGLVASLTVYRRNKSIKDSIIAFILWFLTLGTPLHFILVGLYVGSWINRRIYKSWSHNWGAFIVSLLGIPILFAVWQVFLKLAVAVVATSVDDIGGAIVLGTGFAAISVVLMLIGFALYLLSSFYASFKRRRNSPRVIYSPV